MSSVCKCLFNHQLDQKPAGAKPTKSEIEALSPLKGPFDDPGDGPKSTYYSAEEAKGTWQSLRTLSGLIHTTFSTELMAVFLDLQG
ncbi:unnamed protein product [Clonostachys byssicola]|uniref:Uncharacterized protein n=1 Tax=Clonostachys byssicola TaxID=160290 RepID=A0A9N9Y978_9HYPO|nr:unnamed protein product [Clonostachys byssicola]